MSLPNSDAETDDVSLSRGSATAKTIVETVAMKERAVALKRANISSSRAREVARVFHR